MLPGFNHNIKYKNMVFHVQTEDSGEENPLIISHLFIGGNIIATKKTNYSHLIGSPNLSTDVRTIMENQHKELIKELITGKYDSHPLIMPVQEKTDINGKESNGTIKKTETAENKVSIPQPKPAAKQQEQSRFKPVNSTSAFTVFGEGTISEESLDKIILKYLRENKNQ
ncbi:MAG: hypothetical protein N3B13_12665 [Deltaproteobacteria bacterium]|nr:hypothetical protein [Deltaproteobacteria bacterium]